MPAFIDGVTVHCMQSGLHYEILSLEGGGTSAGYVMLLEHDHPEALPGQGGAGGKPAQASSDNEDITIHPRIIV